MAHPIDPRDRGGGTHYGPVDPRDQSGSKHFLDQDPHLPGWPPGMPVPDGVDPLQANAARMYQYFLDSPGHHFETDRVASEQALRVAPWIRASVRQNRDCLRRMTIRLVQEARITQFLDLGSGLPTAGNIHEVAQGLDPDCRVVYLDRDPIAVAHSRHILTGNDLATMIWADIREPAAVLDHDEVRCLLDFGQPMAVFMLSVLMWVDDPEALLPQYVSPLAEGSYLAVTHATKDYAPPRLHGAIEEVDATYAAIGQPVISRNKTDIARLLSNAGLEIVDPGVVFLVDWRPELGSVHESSDADTICLAAMGYKP